MKFYYLRDIPEVKPLRSLEDIKPSTRLFHEVGYHRVFDKNEEPSEHNFIRSGRFKEIKDVAYFTKSEIRLSDPAFIRYYNFMITEYKGTMVSAVSPYDRRPKTEAEKAVEAAGELLTLIKSIT